MATVHIPSLLRSFSEGRSNVTVEGETLRKIFDNLETVCPGIREHIVAEGRIRPDLSVVVDQEIVDTGLLYRVPAGSEIVLVPRISGGQLVG